MKILLITEEAWNDRMYGKNVLSNWFNDTDAEFAQVYASNGAPFNSCCSNYYQITDEMVMRSYIGEKAGRAVENENKNSAAAQFNREMYLKIKAMTTDSLRACRDLVWFHARYDEAAIRGFIKSFNPDIVFCPRLATLKMIRLEMLVAQYTCAPFIAFTGDNEYSLRQFRYSLLWWYVHLKKHRIIKKWAQRYKMYYTLSQRQADEYAAIFHVPAKVLYKGGVFAKEKVHTKINAPIVLAYVGKLYCNRWKTLSEIVLALKLINKASVRMILQIYTTDKVTKAQLKALDDHKNSFMNGACTPEEVEAIYARSDIALHIEGFDLKNKYLTQHSFSTKIIECLSCGCAVMTVAWRYHAGFEYLERQNAAILIDSPKKILPTLTRIANNPSITVEYAEKALRCGQVRHQIKDIRENLLKDFGDIIAHESITD